MNRPSSPKPPFKDSGVTDSGLKEVFSCLQKTRPLVHCLSNPLTAPYVADIVSGLGCRPSMTNHPDELPDFIQSTKAVMINLGLPDERSVKAYPLAATLARDSGIPWLLDPVMIHRSALRREMTGHLLDLTPAIIRLNQQEYMSLYDHQIIPEHATESSNSIWCVTGEYDAIIDRQQTRYVTGGNSQADHVVGLGCCLSAFLTCFLAAAPDVSLKLSDLCYMSIDLFRRLTEKTFAEGATPMNLKPALLNNIWAMTNDA